MKIDLELYQQIRHLKDIEGMSQRAISRRLGISRTTVAKYCNGEHVPWKRKDYSKRSSPVVTQDVIDFILACFKQDEDDGVRKQRHTAHRIYERLVKEHDFAGAESSIRKTVRELRGKISEAHVPLSFDPAELLR